MAGETADTDADGTLNDPQATLPGIPVHIEAIEALEGQMSARDEYIQRLEGQLATASQTHAANLADHLTELEARQREARDLTAAIEHERSRRRAAEARVRALQGSEATGSDAAARFEELLGLLQD